ncbi:hypothetical protein QJS10_CPB20g01896 [Acorus calamus]|uniref:Uncharacterized protein n=1 Tax=Acorus calamus TaxID=4465 RepID=A0AAV9CBV0_ACOCL|nr:hypothetical protein QJS10_CPB20g01896 [Acorus calamus]
MADWALVVVGVVLFVPLSPRLVMELPGTLRRVDRRRRRRRRSKKGRSLRWWSEEKFK